MRLAVFTAAPKPQATAEQYCSSTPPRNACPQGRPLKFRPKCGCKCTTRGKGFFGGLSCPHTHARPHGGRRGTHGVPRDPSIERLSRECYVKASAHALTAHGPGSQRHAEVDFGSVENLLRRRACPSPLPRFLPRSPATQSTRWCRTRGGASNGQDRPLAPERGARFHHRS